MGAARLIARIAPDVTGIDRTFDYLVPDDLIDTVAVGHQVRVPLHGRSVGGWIVELEHAGDPTDSSVVGDGSAAVTAPGTVTTLKTITTWSGYGPSADLVTLSTWAATYWAGRRRNFLAIASPERAVKDLGTAQRSEVRLEPISPATFELLSARRSGTPAPWDLLRIPPASDPIPVVAAATHFGPTLVVTPSAGAARLIAARLGRSGLTVAYVPDDWARAAAGVDVVIGARSAAWAPCPDLAVAIILDEHDEALQSEASPTWHARTVIAERCRRAGAMAVLVSPCPTPVALHLCEPVHPEPAREAAGWPLVETVDLDEDDRWRTSVITSPLIDVLRSESRVLCVLNRTGRARLVACRTCRQLITCEHCDAAAAIDDHGLLVCPRCAATRPPICLHCRSTALANLRAGVTRLREELEAAAGRPVGQITGTTDRRLGGSDGEHAVLVGTEALLHRVSAADVVVFLDFDSELLAPFYSAADHAIALVIRAGRLVGPRRGGGRVLLQTRQGDHPVLAGLRAGDPAALGAYLTRQRQALRLPPFSTVAEISGAGAAEFIDSLGVATMGVDITADRSSAVPRWLLRADSNEILAAVLATGRRPAGRRLRIAVDPTRL